MSARKDHPRVTVVAPGPGDGPNWYLLVRAPSIRPKRVSSGTTDRAEAERIAGEREARMLAQLPPKRGEDPLAVTVYERHVAFREADRLTAKKTASGYRGAVGAIGLALEGVRASALDRNVLESAQRHLLDVQRLEPSTINQYLGQLAHAWKWAHGKKHAGVGPWPGLSVLPCAPTEKRQYTPAELDALLRETLRYAGGRLLPLACLLSETGARISELLALRGRDVDRTACRLTLQSTKTRLRSRTRTVTISADVLSMLPERLADEWVFRSVEDPTKPLPYPTVTGAMQTIRLRAGLAGLPLDVHSFRRYVVRKLHSARVPIKDAMDFLGHASLKTFMGYMRDLQDPEAQRDLLERAREHHDPIASLPGRVTGTGVATAGRKSAGAKDAKSWDRRHSKSGRKGQASRSRTGRLAGSRDERAPSSVAHLTRDERAPIMVALLRALAPRNRDLVLALTHDDGWRAAILALAREAWPESVPAKQRKKPVARRTREAT